MEKNEIEIMLGRSPILVVPERLMLAYLAARSLQLYYSLFSIKLE